MPIRYDKGLVREMAAFLLLMVHLDKFLKK